MTQPTAQEQYMLELINRARRNPGAEATRYGIDLNQGLPVGTISNVTKQPLAFNLDLIDSARDHSEWMLATDTFSHTGAGGSSAHDRMEAAGYNFTGTWASGENITWRGTTGTPNITNFVGLGHEDLFRSSGHRVNILDGDFREIGIGAVQGQFTQNGVTYNAVMTTQNFARSGSSLFFLGVVFDDRVTDDNFYTVGEGLGEITVRAVRQSDGQAFTTTTFDSGGYQIALSSGTYNVTFSGDGLIGNVTRTVTVGTQNVKVDLATDELNNNLSGSNGNDSLFGRGGNDTLSGGLAQDSLDGGSGNDYLYGGDGNDTLFGSFGNDNLDGGTGNDSLMGSSNNDILYGKDGADTLLGGTGNDTLLGGGGTDQLSGSSGADVFAIEGPSNNRDRIGDFQDGVDKLGLSGSLSFNDLSIVFDSNLNSTLIQVDTNNVLAVLAGINSSLITAADFINI